jgi:hypothetical protein
LESRIALSFIRATVLLAVGTFRLKEKPKSALIQQSVRDWSFAEKAKR